MSASEHEEAGELLEARAALRESDARHRLLQAVWETDGNGFVVADSPSWRAYTGQTLEQWLGFGWLDAVHPEDREYAERQWRQAVPEQGIVDAEFRLRSPDGHWRWTNVRAAPVLDADGKIDKWVGMNIDIDARKKAEVDLRAHAQRQAFRLSLEQRLRGLTDPEEAIAATTEALGRFLDVSQVAYAQVEPGGKTVIINREWNDGTMVANARRHQLDDYGPGYIADLRRGENITITDVRLDRRTSTPEALAAFERAGIVGFINIPVVKNERLTAVLAIHSAVPRTWSKEDVALALEIAERTWSAAERAQADIERRESEAQLSAIFAHAAVGLSEISLEGRFERVNDELCRMLGRSRDELLAATVADVTHPEDVALSLETFRATVETGAPASFDKRYLRPDGSLLFANSSLTCLQDEHGRPRAVLAVSADLTDRHEATEALRASEEFNRRVLASSADCIKVLDLCGRLEFMSAGALCLMEVDDFSDVAGRSWSEFWPADERHKALEAIGVAKDGGTGRFEGCADTMMGNQRCWDVIVTPISGPDGKPEKLLSVSRDVTATKIAEQRLRQSEAQFRDMTNAIPSIVWVTDGDGKVEYFNRQWFEYTGAEPMPSSAEQVSRDFTHPEDAAPTMAAFNAARESGQTYNVEHRIRSATGDYRWFLVRGDPQADIDTGEIIRWFGTSTDIHDRKMIEAALSESEEQLRLATENAEVGFWDVDVVNDVLTWPPRVKAMFGISPDVPVSMADFYAGLHADDRESTASAFAAASDPGQRALYDVEYRTVGKEDGVVRWVAAKGRGLFEGDQCVRLVGTAIDITARRSAEAALRESEARVRALTDNLPAGMVYQISTGPDGTDRRFLYVSQSHEKLTGIPADAVLADPTIPYHLVLEEDRELMVQAEADAIRNKAPFDVEMRFRRTDGCVRWCRILSAAREQEDGSLIWDGIQIDTTEHKEAELQLRELNDTLEARVHERTRELQDAHEQLRQSQKMEAMGALTGGVAHDFNNLLSPIVGSLDLLQRRGFGSDREARLIDGALQSAERARVLVQRLLAFARRQPLQARPVAIGTLVSGMADLIASTTGPQIKVAVEVAPNLPAAVADANQLEMAILNLSVNARDAMPDGGVLRISADLQTIDDAANQGLKPGEYVRLSVADTGAGMDQETQSRAVEPFFSTKGVGRGTGLGLSMVHGLASQLGGALIIKSTPGVGTKVQILLPATANAEVVAESTAQATPISSRTGTALLVDDEEFVRLSTADMLGDLGYEVLQASSAEDALNLIKAGAKYDLLVTDHLMPGMNGTDLARELRATRPSLPILLVSGFAEAEGVAPDLARLIKPFRQSDLAAKLGMLDQPSGPDA
nr:PAS domain S-box protein [uncultured Sphingomonas sp.]